MRRVRAAVIHISRWPSFASPPATRITLLFPLPPPRFEVCGVRSRLKSLRSRFEGCRQQTESGPELLTARQATPEARDLVWMQHLERWRDISEHVGEMEGEFRAQSAFSSSCRKNCIYFNMQVVEIYESTEVKSCCCAIEVCYEAQL